MLIDLFMDTNGAGTSEHARLSLAALSRAAVFDVQNVADYFVAQYVGRTKEAGSVHVNMKEELPNVAPLGDLCWFEWAMVRDGETQQQAVLLDTIDMETAPDDVLTFKNATPQEARDHAAERGVRWLTFATVFVRRINPDGASAFGVSDFCPSYSLGGHGGLKSVQYFTGDDPHPILPGDPVVDKNHFEQIATFIALLATCFAHCKGVVVHTQEPTRNDRRRAERLGRRLPTVFRTIDIRPALRVLRDNDAEDHVHGGVRWHRVRGHFVNYTEDRPLFGKYTGTYYRRAHERGDLTVGVVAKRYRSHPEGEMHVHGAKQQPSKPPAHAHV